jgi:hypothetical protein
MELRQIRQVYRDIPSDLAHVNSASFVGVTSIKRPDGFESAKEIHIFPEELRDVLHESGEFHALRTFILNRSGHMLDAWPFLRTVRTRNAAPRKLGNSCANSVGHLVIIDLFRYQAEERIAIQEIH